EHYVLDLVVALPFSAFIGIGLANPDNFVFKNKKVTTLWGGAGITFILWMLMLLTSAEWLSNNLLFVQVFSIWSVLIATILVSIYNNYVLHDAALKIPRSEIKDTKKSETSTAPPWVIAVFAASGFAGLLYDVVYAKSFAVTLGSTSLA